MGPFNLHTHMKIKILQHLTFRPNHSNCGNDLLISEITASVLVYPDKCHAYCLSLTTYSSNVMVSSTQIPPQIGNGKLYLRLCIPSSFGHARIETRPLVWPVTVSAAGPLKSQVITGNYRPQNTTLYNNKSFHICRQRHSRYCKIY